jgi:peptide/nickel transport system substrate-binding protein
VREKDGQRFSFTLLSNAENQRRTDTGTILQRYWAEVGVEARLARQEFQTFSSRLIARDYEAAMYGWQVPLSPDVSGMWAPEAMLNFVSYREPELDRLMQTALAQETEQEAAPYWKATARLLARDQPYTWLFYMDQVVPIRDRLRGPHVDTYGMYQNVWEWWVAEPR